MNNLASIEQILQKLNIKEKIVLGEGGEGTVFAFDENRVVKIYKGGNPGYLQSISAFQRTLAEFALPFEVPLVYEIGKVGGTYYTIEKRLHGVTLDKLFGGLAEETKPLILKRYFEGLKAIHSVKLPWLPYGQILASDDQVTGDCWQEYLRLKMVDKIGRSREWLARDVTNFEQKVERYYEIIETELGCEEKTLVHGDYFHGNVLVQNLAISAVLDFSPHTVVGDYRMDVCGAITFLELDPTFTPTYLNYLYTLAGQAYGRDIGKFIGYYRLYYSFLFADSFLFDKQLYEWCLNNLNEESYWQ